MTMSTPSVAPRSLTPSAMTGIGSLPEELLLSILDLLDRRAVVAVNLTCSWLYKITLPRIWRSIELVDQCTDHRSMFSHGRESDDHDDTPLLRLLLLFERKPQIATCVQVLTHRCHLRPPPVLDQWLGLTETPFCSQTLSIDPRTIWLVKRAAISLNNVHTLRIVFGHPMLTEALLRCFFDERRPNNPNFNGPVKKLWLENCRISAGLNVHMEDFPYGLPPRLNFDGLQSVRFRRLPLDYKTYNSYDNPRGKDEHVHERSPNDDDSYTFYNIDGKDIYHSVPKPSTEWLELMSYLLGRERPLRERLETAQSWDDEIYDRLDSQAHGCLPEEIDHAMGLPMSYSIDPLEQYYGKLLSYGPKTKEDVQTWEAVKSEYGVHRGVDVREKRWPVLGRIPWQRTQREQIPGTTAAIRMLQSASRTLTSLNLDWVLTWFPDGRDCDYHIFFRDLFACRFPNLRALQFRNCVVKETKMPSDVFLFAASNPAIAPGGLEFMEAHSKLKCLAWPIEHFFPPGTSSTATKARINSVIASLSLTLTDLRVDTNHAQHPEPLSESVHCDRPEARLSRLSFITEFAAQMTSLESIKLEGGMPRDERREVLRALHHCPLQKIVLIGVASPIGNSWGRNGREALRSEEAISAQDGEGLEAEDIGATLKHGFDSKYFGSKQQPPANFAFAPEFGWAGSPPMLHTMLTFFGNTIRDLKFCGSQGAPILFRRTPITEALLGPLKHFHRLESLTLSFWLPTMFEDQSRDAEVMKFWRDSQSASSTALVVKEESLPPGCSETSGWAKELKTKYAPEALVREMVAFVGPKVSSKAKDGAEGLRVRASFALGQYNHVFDVDVWIGLDSDGVDVCLKSTGPMENTDAERRKEKLDNRGWF